MSRPLRVGVVGGGIGGVALSRALTLRGIENHVFERASAFGEVGAGVQVTPNAVKVLKALGLTDDLKRVGFLPQAMVGRNWRSGRELFRTPLKESCPQIYGAESAQFTGHMCWRALVPVDRHPLKFVSPDAAFWMGPHGHLVTYYVNGGAAVPAEKSAVAPGRSA